MIDTDYTSACAKIPPTLDSHFIDVHLIFALDNLNGPGQKSWDAQGSCVRLLAVASFCWILLGKCEIFVMRQEGGTIK